MNSMRLFFPFFPFAPQINSHPAVEYLPEVGRKLDRKSDEKGKACPHWVLLCSLLSCKGGEGGRLQSYQIR